MFMRLPSVSTLMRLRLASEAAAGDEDAFPCPRTERDEEEDDDDDDDDGACDDKALPR
jgi:hypothetical protein